MHLPRHHLTCRWSISDGGLVRSLSSRKEKRIERWIEGDKAHAHRSIHESGVPHLSRIGRADGS